MFGFVPELRLCQVTIPAGLVQELAAIEELQFLEPVVPPLEPLNDYARSGPSDSRGAASHCT